MYKYVLIVSSDEANTYGSVFNTINMGRVEGYTAHTLPAFDGDRDTATKAPYVFAKTEAEAKTLLAAFAEQNPDKKCSVYKVCMTAEVVRNPAEIKQVSEKGILP